MGDLDFLYEKDSEIENEILPKISNAFYSTLKSLLVETFGEHILEREVNGLYEVEDYAGTPGWYEAFKVACVQTDSMWLYEYYRSLEWCYSDALEGRIAEILGNKAEKESKMKPTDFFYSKRCIMHTLIGAMFYASKAEVISVLKEDYSSVYLNKKVDYKTLTDDLFELVPIEDNVEDFDTYDYTKTDLVEYVGHAGYEYYKITLKISEAEDGDCFVSAVNVEISEK